MPDMDQDRSDPRRETDKSAEAEVIEFGVVAMSAPANAHRADRWIPPAAIGVAVLILVAGVVLANRPDLAIVAASPSGSASVSPSEGVALASPTTNATGSPRPTRFVPTTPPCQPWDHSRDASLVARSGFSTWQLATYEQGNVAPTAPGDWSSRIAQARSAEPAAAIRVATGGEVSVATYGMACFATATATFVRLDTPDAFALITVGGPIDPFAPAARFVAPAPGDWLVRFVVEIAVPGDARWVEASSRLLVGASGVPPVPVVLPEVACGSWTDGPRAATLVVDGVAVPDPVPGTGDPAVPIVPYGAVVEIRLAGDRCAIAWMLRGVRRPEPDNLRPAAFEILYRSALPDPRVASQNRFRLAPEEPRGTWDLSATFTFPDGTEVTGAWAIAYEDIVVPSLLVGRQGDATRAKAWIGCGLYIEAANGSSQNGDGCATNLPSRPLERLAVPVGSRLTFDVGGFEITHWSVESGVVTDGEDSLRHWTSDGNGFLRGASSPPVDFPAPRAGSWVLQIGTSLVRPDGLRISGTWYVAIDVK